MGRLRRQVRGHPYATSQVADTIPIHADAGGGSPIRIIPLQANESNPEVYESS